MNYEKQIVVSEDGSCTLRIEALKESYHSLHGALTESNFVYIETGLKYWHLNNSNKPCSVLEIGYGTGLVTYLSYLASHAYNIGIEYTAIEAYPLTKEETQLLKYDLLFKGTANQPKHSDFTACPWEKETQVSPNFKLFKQIVFFQNFHSKSKFDLIFYDAFGAHAQPDLWDTQWMQKSFDLLNSGGIWVSYCAKGAVRRSLKEVGFTVERLPGPPGKRHMMRAIKP